MELGLIMFPGFIQAYGPMQRSRIRVKSGLLTPLFLFFGIEKMIQKIRQLICMLLDHNWQFKATTQVRELRKFSYQCDRCRLFKTIYLGEEE